MESVSYSLIILLALLIVFSAFFSSSETAFSSVNKIRMKKYAEENRPGGKLALRISENFDQTISTILVGNNLVNIAGTTIAAKIFTDLFGESSGLVISTVVMTILVLIFGEILPKSYAKENAETYALKISGVLSFLIKVLSPVTFLFVRLKNWLSSLVTSKESEPSVTEEELKVMVEIGEEEGIIDQQEKELVHSALDFNDIIVGEVLTRRIDMVAIEVHASTEEIKSVFFKERFSRIPVYEGHIDNIIGILSEREFLSMLVKNESFQLKDLLREPMFVVESLRISTLLPELQKHKTHMAVVIDEFGGTEGLITMEDILEEIVGEIWDEHDEKKLLVKQIDNGSFIFSAEIGLDDFSQFVSIPLPDSNYHSLGGWIVEQFERIPTTGDQFEYSDVTIIIHKVEGHRIRSVQVVTDK
ncbi:hemolysin family protein [Desertibacillus haloalkaliphilus]|uniref:hemolysin family protein n=1 Tax=Desertibacillus haloalkaliphilus TaxID=1328930 RepID=UPI001C253899|nr:hemolysin family protein [Desertibacillus haloalkaliphilus]MBU8907408.1 hemolysin family protein [Desertibacillus haloalkaliphilus]